MKLQTNLQLTNYENQTINEISCLKDN